MPATTALREALNQGISSGIFVDTKITLYSRRDSSGRVCRPKALYANSHVLKTVPYFEDLLFGGFAESQSKDFEEEIDEGEFAEDYGYLSDSDLEEDEDASGPLLNSAQKPEVRWFDWVEVPGGDPVACEDEEHGKSVRKGKVVKISDVAYVTFQAFLVYLYTDEIGFAPFGSEENRRSRGTEIADSSDEKVPCPSPKSIYRLADKYDVPKLKERALGGIRGGLAKCDIIEESFSEFAFQYDEVRNLYLEQLASNWRGDPPAGTTRASVKAKIDNLLKGDPELASEALCALLESACRVEATVAPNDENDNLPWITPPDRWEYVKTALIKSIRNGVFFDRKYWARHSGTGDGLKPIYSSSTIMSDKARQLGKLKYLKRRSPFGQNPGGDVHAESDYEGDSTDGFPETNEENEENEGYTRRRSPFALDLGGDVHVESDCEGDSVDGLPETNEENDVQTRTALINGSFSVWKSLFFYRCTGEISFAPLRSQGIDSRSKYIRQNSSEGTPPPCSPKSIYALAGSLGIWSLRRKALEDIRGKITSENAMEEILSWFAAGPNEMPCDFLVQHLTYLQKIALVNAGIRGLHDSSPSFYYEVLEPVLERALRANGVKLQCGSSYCSWSRDPGPYSSVGLRLSCPRCKHQPMQCGNCTFRRNDYRSSCQGCRRRFI